MSVIVVGIVPIGLFLATSVAYAMGALRMAGKSALGQRLSAVESLSNVDVLCLDKTGTITTNILVLEDVHPFGMREQTERKAGLLGCNWQRSPCRAEPMSPRFWPPSLGATALCWTI